MSMWVKCVKAQANRAEYVPRAMGIYKWNYKGEPYVMVRTKVEQKQYEKEKR